MPDGQPEAPPVPDPTVLTTEQLLREVDRVKELLTVRVDGLEDVFNEKFETHDRQFGLVEQQRVEQKSDTKAAVDAALTAQKEAVSEQTTASERSIEKASAATTKSIEQLGAKFDTAFEGQRRDIDDLKERMTSVEQQKVGGRETKDRQGDTTGRLIGTAAAFFAFCALVASIVIAASG